jgi:hypothetical protein
MTPEEILSRDPGTFSREQEAQNECIHLGRDIAKLRAENEFLKSFLQCRSPKMDGQHSWTWMSGWQTNQLRGPNRDDAVKAAMTARDADREKMAQ